jgi:hypothetical protein
VITSCTPIAEQKEGGYTHNIKGNLTIKDKTNEDCIRLLSSTPLATAHHAWAPQSVDRSKFDVKYRIQNFFCRHRRQGDLR